MARMLIISFHLFLLGFSTLLQTHKLSVISVQPLSLSSSLSLKFEVRSGWKTFFTCCCCCCLCPWATTPLAHNICVRSSREFSCPGHNLLSLPQRSRSQSLLPSLSRSSGWVQFEELMFFSSLPFRFTSLWIKTAPTACHNTASRSKTPSSVCQTQFEFITNGSLPHYWKYDCVYACMKERDRGQMVRRSFSELKTVEKRIMSWQKSIFFSVKFMGISFNTMQWIIQNTGKTHVENQYQKSFILTRYIG